MTRLVRDLLRAENISYHQIDSLVKAVSSLSKKIDSKNNKYTDLSQITDLVGIRIITYLGSEVDLVNDVLTKEFTIDTKNSIDKRELETNVFGYRSLHLIVSLDDGRCKLAEYKQYVDLKCEIQIRSILQHAWAEIEHDLGYKSALSVPQNYTRSFNRLAALLESADIEFVRLKKELMEYECSVGELIQDTPEDDLSNIS